MENSEQFALGHELVNHFHHFVEASEWHIILFVNFCFCYLCLGVGAGETFSSNNSVLLYMCGFIKVFCVFFLLKNKDVIYKERINIWYIQEDTEDMITTCILVPCMKFWNEKNWHYWKSYCNLNDPWDVVKTNMSMSIS